MYGNNNNNGQQNMDWIAFTIGNEKRADRIRALEIAIIQEDDPVKKRQLERLLKKDLDAKRRGQIIGSIIIIITLILAIIIFFYFTSNSKQEVGAANEPEKIVMPGQSSSKDDESMENVNSSSIPDSSSYESQSREEDAENNYTMQRSNNSTGEIDTTNLTENQALKWVKYHSSLYNMLANIENMYYFKTWLNSDNELTIGAYYRLDSELKTATRVIRKDDLAESYRIDNQGRLIKEKLNMYETEQVIADKYDVPDSYYPDN